MAKAENAEATNKTEKVAKATTKKATKEAKIFCLNSCLYSRRQNL